jgi:hypothetical protein
VRFDKHKARNHNKPRESVNDNTNSISVLAEDVLGEMSDSEDESEPDVLVVEQYVKRVLVRKKGISRT